MGASEEIRLLIRAETAKAVKEMKKFSGELDKTGKKTKGAEKTSMSFSKTLGVLTGVVGGLAVGYKALIEPASELEEAQGKFNVVFRDNIEVATQWRDTLVNAYNLTKIEATNFLSSTQDLLKPMGISADLAGRMSNQVVKLAADLGSFNNVPVPEALAAIQGAMTGSGEMMKKFGVTINETTMKQKALALGLSDGKKPLNAQTRAFVAMQMALDGSSDAMGDVKRTSDSFANVMRRVRANLVNTATEIGGKMLPGLTNLAKSFRDATGAGGFLKDLALGIATRLNALSNSLALIVRGVTVASIAMQKLTADSDTEAKALEEQYTAALKALDEQAKITQQSFIEIAAPVEEAEETKNLVDEAANAEVTAADFAKQQIIQKEQEKLQAKKDIRAQFNEFLQSDFEKRMAKLEEENAMFMESDQLSKEEKLLAQEEFEAKMQELRLNKANETMQQIQQMTQQSTQFLGNIFKLDQLTKEKALNQEYNKRRAHILANIKDEDKQKKALAALEEEFQGKKRKLARDAAIKEKGIKIATAVISTAASIVNMLATSPWPVNIVMAALAAATGAANIAVIASTPIPAAQEGGFLPGTPEGTIVRAGENTAAEAILPLENEEAQEKISEALGGAGGGTTININVENLFAAEDVPEQMAIAIDQALLDLKQQGNSGFATSIQDEQI